MFGLLGQATFETTTTTTTISDGEVAVFAGALLMMMLFAIVVAYVINALIIGFVFKKAGRPAWPAWVPVYNTWVLFEIAGKPGWWALISLIPFIGSIIFLVLYIIAMLELATRFGKSATFAIFGLVLFSFVGFIILAFDSSKYNAAAAGSNSGFGPQPQPQQPQQPTQSVQAEVQPPTTGLQSNDQDEQTTTPPTTPPSV